MRSPFLALGGLLAFLLHSPQSHAAGGDLSLAYQSAYIFRGSELAGHSLQIAGDVFDGPFYAGLWSNFPIDEEEVSPEIDLFWGKTWERSEWFSFDTTATLYFYPDATTGNEEHTFELGIGGFGQIPLLNLTLYPSLYLYHDFTLVTWTTEFSVGHGRQIRPGLNGEIGLTAGYVAAEEDPDYAYATLKGALVWSLPDDFALRFNLGLSANSQAETNRGNDANLWAGVTLERKL